MKKNKTFQDSILSALNKLIVILFFVVVFTYSVSEANELERKLKIRGSWSHVIETANKKEKINVEKYRVYADGNLLTEVSDNYFELYDWPWEKSEVEFGVTSVYLGLESEMSKAIFVLKSPPSAPDSFQVEVEFKFILKDNLNAE